MAGPELKRGYSKPVVAGNIALLVRYGYPRDKAIVAAMNLGRHCYFRRFPQGALPSHLVLRGHGRLSQNFTTSGAPIYRNLPHQRNPVKELDISESDMINIRRDVQKQISGRGAEVRKAAELYSEFTGHDDPQLTKLRVPTMPKVALEVGMCDGILYTTVRDGKTEKYIHEFKAASRPLLCSSPDGKTLLLLGGAFNFTDRGIVDKK